MMKISLSEKDIVEINGIKISGKDFNDTFAHLIKSKPKPIKEVHPSFSTMRLIYETKYNEYYWQAIDATNLNKIIQKITFAFEQNKKKKPTPEDVIRTWACVINNLPDWYVQNKETSISTLCKKWTTILETVRDNLAGEKSAKTVVVGLNNKVYS